MIIRIRQPSIGISYESKSCLFSSGLLHFCIPYEMFLHFRLQLNQLMVPQ